MPSRSSFQTVNKCLFSVTVLPFLCFLWVILLFQKAPNRSAEMLPSVSEPGKAAMCLMGKVCPKNFPHRYSTDMY